MEESNQLQAANYRHHSIPDMQRATAQNTHHKLQPKRSKKQSIDTAVMQCIVQIGSCGDEDSEVKCRYCFGGPLGWVVKQPLLSPCWCSGSLAYVHRSCLEKWLTIRKQSSCDLCKYEFVTRKKYKHIREITFPSMDGDDISLLITTILVYITFIFQFLAAAYIGMLAEHLPTPVVAVSMTGLGLGLVWFLVGCIALTVVTYTSDYWIDWRKMNKKISIVMKSIKNNSDNRNGIDQNELNVDEPEQESNCG